MSEEMLIPLCLPKAHLGWAIAHGAAFSRELHAWCIDARLAHREEGRPFRRFLPARYRPGNAGPYLQPRPVPLPLWGWNLRALLRQRDWDRIRRDAYAWSGGRCLICGGRGRDWPVEADEVWVCDDTSLTQTLAAVSALCPDCHAVRHWGRTTAIGRRDAALAHMAGVNRSSPAECRVLADANMAQWATRSRREWTLDITWVETRYGMTPHPDGAARAAAAHAQLRAG